MPRRAKTIEPGVSAYQTAKGVRWRWVADAGTVNGKRSQRRRQGYRSERAAQDARRAFVKAVERGSLVDAGQRTLASYLTDEWLPHYQRVRPRSYGIRGWGARHAVAALGTVRLDRLTTIEIQRLYGAMQDAGYAPRTIRNLHDTLNVALRQAVTWRLLERSPVTDAEPPAVPRAPMTVYTPAQVAHLIASETDERYRALWALSVTTGMRRGELLGLRWEGVDLERGVVHVRGLTKTVSGQRSILLPPAMVAMLREHQAQQARRRAALGVGWREHGLVFDAGAGHPVALSTYAAVWRCAVKRAGLPYIRPHGLRHTNATLALAMGIHPKIVSERLGHSAIAITLDLYSHASVEMQRGVADALGAIVFGAADAPQPDAL